MGDPGIAVIDARGSTEHREGREPAPTLDRIRGRSVAVNLDDPDLRVA